MVGGVVGALVAPNGKWPGLSGCRFSVYLHRQLAHGERHLAHVFLVTHGGLTLCWVGLVVPNRMWPGLSGCRFFTCLHHKLAHGVCRFGALCSSVGLEGWWHVVWWCQMAGGQYCPGADSLRSYVKNWRVGVGGAESHVARTVWVPILYMTTSQIGTRGLTIWRARLSCWVGGVVTGGLVVPSGMWSGLSVCRFRSKLQ